MRFPFRMGLCVLAAVVLIAVVGCPDPRTTNQGGGSLLTVAAKLMSNPSDPPIGDLNPDEMQILTDNLAMLAGQFGYSLPEGVTISSLTDEQAQAIADFLDDNGVTYLSDLQNLASSIESGEIELPAALQDLAEAMGADLA
jgi:hypothetical protein